MINETIPFYMNKFEKIVGENNGYFVNGKVYNLFKHFSFNEKLNQT